MPGLSLEGYYGIMLGNYRVAMVTYLCDVMFSKEGRKRLVEDPVDSVVYGPGTQEHLTNT